MLLLFLQIVLKISFKPKKFLDFVNFPPSSSTTPVGVENWAVPIWAQDLSPFFIKYTYPRVTISVVYLSRIRVLPSPTKPRSYINKRKPWCSLLLTERARERATTVETLENPFRSSQFLRNGYFQGKLCINLSQISASLLTLLFVSWENEKFSLLSFSLRCNGVWSLWYAVPPVPSCGKGAPYRIWWASEDLPDEALGHQWGPSQVQVLVSQRFWLKSSVFLLYNWY